MSYHCATCGRVSEGVREKYTFPPYGCSYCRTLTDDMQKDLEAELDIEAKAMEMALNGDVEGLLEYKVEALQNALEQFHGAVKQYCSAVDGSVNDCEAARSVFLSAMAETQKIIDTF